MKEYIHHKKGHRQYKDNMTKKEKKEALKVLKRKIRDEEDREDANDNIVMKKKKKKKKRETKPRLLRNYRPRKFKCRNHQSMRILAPKMPCER